MKLFVQAGKPDFVRNGRAMKVDWAHIFSPSPKHPGGLPTFFFEESGRKRGGFSFSLGTWYYDLKSTEAVFGILDFTSAYVNFVFPARKAGASLMIPRTALPRKR